ncbi:MULTISPECIES: type III-B CRISPR-associated protein Cas10/Cmr2 [Fischerella]|uniref:Type III-B CRISPR-associated protein Cas10/Cmr2 n=1 Tax=Fischerella muscicola CCMEE 5323 TaxID=2019572 RepID=A0A2N6K560_FISMU|nr:MULTISPECIES: type III-B CRISPR-associated protein Cas10/Cmr2 [Fischerella]MBD2429963.1 type III-B CRISPR-associated protein Cas10/Cmr2 [Fischerella sp. FACHB-380]PLZ91532.1 type III-B CRISPR-associated protein Cas10/Cmr2 [Fischerella muscicola CCMEE 5323]
MTDSTATKATLQVNNPNSITIALCWCLAWGDKKQPQFPLSVLQQMRQALHEGKEVPEITKSLVEQVKQLQSIPEGYFPKTLDELNNDYPELWKQQTRIGLVYGGATKIKQYVFEAAKLPDIRGASALLDRINLVDLPAFFGCEQHPDYPQCQQAKNYCKKVRENWLDKPENFPQLSQALIPELIIYSTGGNILAFCPAAFVDDLANAIEKRYTEETLTANSCAVGGKFKPLEIQFGLLPDELNNETFWLEKYLKNLDNQLIHAYFAQPDTNSEEAFKERKTFNELAGKLAAKFNQRRNGNKLQESDRSLRCYPPMFETHPYLKRDEGDRRSAIIQAKSSPDDPSEGLPDDPWFSEASARKRYVGQIAKRDNSSKKWYEKAGFAWEPGEDAVESWVDKFEQYLHDTPHKYYGKIRSENLHPSRVKEALSVREIGDASAPNGFIAYIYADGNNMGGYIQKEIKNPEDYQRFSRDISDATEKSVYAALTKHLQPHKLNSKLQAERKSTKEVWIHPFEILTIGGDDVMLIVPADKALAIAKTIGEEFERQLLNKGKRYKSDKNYNPQLVHRYHGKKIITDEKQCKLSMSTGVLITAEDTPIYYAEKLTSQLLKSAKKYAKDLRKQNYYGGTVDFLVMKAVTMISSNIGEFRSQGLIKSGQGQQKLKLYAVPYTLHELGGLLETAQVLKDAEFPRSQLYQIRNLLERGKQTAILNYRYFRLRLTNKNAQNLLKTQFEDAWCKPKQQNNNGNLAPWMSLKEDKQGSQEKVTYETIWRDLVDLYPFIKKSHNTSNPSQLQQQTSST